MSGLKRKDIQKCCCCQRGVMHSNCLTLFKLVVETHTVDLGAIRRLNGLEQMISPVLASVMGPDEDLTKQLEDSRAVLACMECATTKTLVEILEA